MNPSPQIISSQSSSRFLKLATLILFKAFVLSAAATPSVNIGTSQLIKGESTLITIQFTEEIPDQTPNIKSSADLLFRTGGKGSMLQIHNGKRVKTTEYRFQLTAMNEGNYQIPPIEYTIKGKRHTIEGIPINVFPHTALQWSEITDQFTESLPYATAVLVPKDKLYVGESVSATVKLILPTILRIADPRLPELEKSNLSAWRFEADRQAVSTINLSSRPHQVYSYTSVISPLSTGATQLGPGNIRPIVRVSNGRRGFFNYQDIALDIEVGQKNLTSLPLPSPIPSNFSGGIGNFQISAEVENPRAEPGSPLTVILGVQGKGNLDHLSAPKLTDQTDWKLYEAAKHTRDQERRVTMGQVKFTQIMRPEKNKDEIPPFSLTFFNPDTAQYRTLTTGAIPILASAVSSSTVPLKEYSGNILGLISPKPDTPRRSPLLSALTRWWQLLPAALCLFLIWIFFQKKIFPKMRPSEAEKDLSSAVSHLRQLDGSLFLREVGHFIETRLPDDRHDEFTSNLLVQRDQNCYTQDKLSSKMTTEEKELIINTLRSKALN